MQEENKVATLMHFSKEIKISRAFKKDNRKIISGIASSDVKDDYGTIFSDQCQVGFVEDCQNFNIIVEMYHQEENNHPFTSNIGKIISASLLRENDKTLFQVEIELNQKSPIANYIYDVIENPDPSFGEPDKIGMSVYGTVQKSHYEYIDSVYTKIYDRVSLRRIALTDQPSNPEAFAEAVSRESAEKQNQSEVIENKDAVVQEETVSRDSITIQTDYQSASSLINQMTSCPNCDNQSMSMDMPEEPTKPIITAQEVKTKVDALINEMVAQITALQNSALTPQNLLMLLCELVDKYEDDVCSLDCEVNSCDVMESEDVARSSATLEKKPKELSERIKSKIKDFENARQSDQQQPTSSGSTSSETIGLQQQPELRHDTSEIKQNQPIIQQEVIQEVKEEMVSRASIKEDISNMAKELISSLTTSFNEKFETLNQEIDRLKKMPVSTPAHQIGLTVSRSSNDIASLRARFRNNEKLTDDEYNILRKDAMKSWNLNQ